MKNTMGLGELLSHIGTTCSTLRLMYYVTHVKFLYSACAGKERQRERERERERERQRERD